MCSAAELSDRTKFPLFGRTLAVDSQVGPSLISLLKYTYNWTRVAIICQNSTKWTSLRDHLLEEFDKNGIVVATEYLTVNPAFYSKKFEGEFRKALTNIKQTARSKYTLLFVTSIKVTVYLQVFPV